MESSAAEKEPRLPKKRASLERKRSARIAAVQGIFSQRVLEKPLNGDRAAAQISKQWASEQLQKEPEWNVDVSPAKTLLETILIGVAEIYDELLDDISGVLREGWKMERLNHLLASILLAGAYELKCDTSRETAIIIDEYTTIAAAFLDDGEIDFVSGALHNLAKQYRDISED